MENPRYGTEDFKTSDQKLLDVRHRISTEMTQRDFDDVRDLFADEEPEKNHRFVVELDQYVLALPLDSLRELDRQCHEQILPEDFRCLSLSTIQGIVSHELAVKEDYFRELKEICLHDLREDVVNEKCLAFIEDNPELKKAYDAGENFVIGYYNLHNPIN